MDLCCDWIDRRCGCVLSACYYAFRHYTRKIRSASPNELEGINGWGRSYWEIIGQTRKLGEGRLVIARRGLKG